MPEIEFLDPEPRVGADEDLVVGARHRRPPAGRRTRVAVGVLAVLAAAAAVGTLERHDGARHDAAPGPAPSTTASPSATAEPLPVLPTAGFTEAIALPNCAGLPVSSCRFVLSAPGDVLIAIQVHLGAVTHLRVATLEPVRGTTSVRRRTIASQAGEDNVQVDIRPATTGQRTRSGTSYVGAFATVYATAVHKGIAVSVSVSGPQTQTPSEVSVAALAADRRLLATD